VEGERGGPLFAGQSWAPPARPASPKDEVAAKPVAPAFPYKYAGWYKEGRSGKTKVYLSKGNELLDVDAGQVLDGAWKIDSISEDRIGVTFIAGGQQLAVMVSNPVVEAAATAAAASQALLRAPAVARAPSRSPASIASSGSTQASSPMVVAGTMPFGMATQQHAGAQDVSPQPQPPAAVAAAPISAPTAVPSGRLGSEVPTTGSMPRGPAPTGTPMQIGPPPGGAFPSGPTPRGRLGL